MNKTHIREIARDILNNKAQFRMNTGYHDCGAPCCIAGFCARKQLDINNGTPDSIMKYFGISRHKAGSLYAPENYFKLYGEAGYISPEHAASVLFYLADKGIVDWSIKEYGDK